MDACDAVTSCRLALKFCSSRVETRSKTHVATFACARATSELLEVLNRGRQHARSLVVGFRQTIAHAVRLRIAFFPATMAYHMSAQQYDATFKPTRLNNWEVPAIREREPMPRPPGFRSVPIVDENGHLLPGMPKRLTSFSTGYETTAPKRWPVTPSAPFTGASTMGYKGIQTTYLPTSTVFTRNNPDSDEFNYK